MLVTKKAATSLLSCSRTSIRALRLFNSVVNNGDEVTVGIVDAQIRCGQPKGGVDQGAKAIRQAGLMERIAEYKGIQVRDHGTIPLDTIVPHAGDYFDTAECKSPVRNPELAGQSNERISKTVQQMLQTNDIAVVLGGDHSLATGSIHGHSQVDEKVCVLWVDAHCDMNHPASTGSGNIHGMPLHFLMNDLQPKRLEIPSYSWCKPSLASSNIGFIAIRDIDPGEIEILRKYNIPHSSIREIDRNGIAHCVERILDMINPVGTRSLHLSFDIDSIDPQIAPSTGTPVMGGLTYREAMFIGEEVARSGCLRCMDLVEVNPLIGSKEDAQSTAKVAVDVITHALGLSVRNTLNRRFKRHH